MRLLLRCGLIVMELVCSFSFIGFNFSCDILNGDRKKGRFSRKTSDASDQGSYCQFTIIRLSLFFSPYVIL